MHCFFLLTFRKVLAWTLGLTAGLAVVNRIFDYNVKKKEEKEEKEEKVMVEKLKEILPESTIKQYGLRKY